MTTPVSGNRPDSLRSQIGTWLHEGSDCYGIVEIVDNKLKVEFGKSVKVKVVRIERDSIKVKVLETVNLSKRNDCDKQGVWPGDSWWEKEKSLFLSREEAEKYLAENNLVYKNDQKCLVKEPKRKKKRVPTG
ncbi:MAG: hypothetical protein LWW85_07445 [Marinilabiliales bacterium]|nr:hypothetical protein [Marinilabiliales bacterium]